MSSTRNGGGSLRVLISEEGTKEQFHVDRESMTTMPTTGAVVGVGP